MPEHATNAITATSRAEEALNQARKLPSDGYILFQPSEDRTAAQLQNARCATEIVKCLKEERFLLAFQPIVDAKTGTVALYEALLRMNEQEGALTGAAPLILVAERLGLVRLIDRAVMQLIIQTLHAYPQSRLTMNVSGTTATDPHWYDQLLDVITANTEAASRLTIEITETVALNDLSSTRNFVESLRKAGCNVAIDDFGAGYTSFRNLRELPVNILKFDGTFCRNLRQDRNNEYMVRSLIDLSQKYNLKTIAEWVETQSDAEALTEWGIDFLQGNLLGQASIISPWGKAGSKTFAMAPTQIHTFAATTLPAPETNPPEGDRRRVAAENVATTGPVVIPPPEIIQPPDAFTESAPHAPLEINLESDFSELDQSIANLRAALSELAASQKPESAANPKSAVGDAA